MSNIKLFSLIGFQIALTFIISIAFSFLTDYLIAIDFFKDIPCKKTYGCGISGSEIEWSIRHYLWFWMGVILFALQLIRIIVWINEQVDKIQNSNQ